MAANGGAAAPGLTRKFFDRWKAYLAKPEENHPFLKSWFAESDAGGSGEVSGS